MLLKIKLLNKKGTTFVCTCVCARAASHLFTPDFRHMNTS